MPQQTLLQIAICIHHGLTKAIGSGIDIRAMLREQRYATEIVFLCRACEDPALRELGDSFESLAEELRTAHHESVTDGRSHDLLGPWRRSGQRRGRGLRRVDQQPGFRSPAARGLH